MEFFYEYLYLHKERIFNEYNSKTQKNLQFNQQLSKNPDYTQNILLIGDNIDALKLLKQDYEEKIKFIYIDPPYNTQNKNLIYNDNFKSIFLNNNYQTKHISWFYFMFPRLLLAKDLLTEDGVIFISIDDNEYVNLRIICDEVFGFENFIATFVRRSSISGRKDAKYISVAHDYVLLYAKNKKVLTLNKKNIKNKEKKFVDRHFEKRGMFILKSLQSSSKRYYPAADYCITIEQGEEIEVFDGKNFLKTKAPERIEIYPNNDPEDKRWVFVWSKERVYWGIKNDFIVFRKLNDKWKVYYKIYERVNNNDEVVDKKFPYNTILLNFYNENGTREIKQLLGGNYFDYVKPLDLIITLLKIATNKNDIILDFFAGSGTTGHAVMKLNLEDGGKRKFILVQSREWIKKSHPAYDFCIKRNLEPSIANLTIERLNIAGEIIKKTAEQQNLKVGLFEDLKIEVPDIGFKVYDII